jgi:hypothetical protein
MALVAAANNTMPLTPPPDQPMFQNLDAFIKMPDTPMADQFEDDDLESVLSDEELDVEMAHLVTHAKVYAIAEKYVPPVRHCLFSSFCMITPLVCRTPSICACSFAYFGCAVVHRAAVEHRQTPRFASPAAPSPQSQRPMHVPTQIHAAVFYFLRLHVRSYDRPITHLFPSSLQSCSPDRPRQRTTASPITQPL